MRSLLVYVVFVGLPLLILLGLLEAGKGLVPPPSIGGRWRLQDSLVGELGRCLGSDPELDVEQSGVRAQVRIAPAGVVVPIELADGSIAGSSRRLSEDACGNGTLTLHAELPGEEPIPGVMTGTLALTDCDACAPAQFRATRLRAAEAVP